MVQNVFKKETLIFLVTTPQTEKLRLRLIKIKKNMPQGLKICVVAGNGSRVTVAHNDLRKTNL